MNFAAQLIYANYFGEGTSQPRELSEDEEHDPFWQRWDTVGHSDLQSTPGAASRVGSEPVAPPAQITNSSPAPFPAPHVSPPPPQQTLSSPSFQKAPVVRTLKKRQFQAAAPPLLPTPPLAVTPSPPAPPQPSRPAEAAAVAPKQTSTHGTPPLLKSKPPTEPPSRPPRQPLAVAMPLSLSPPQSLPLSPSPSEREALLPAFNTLVSFLLHLALSFILLFLPSEEQRLGPSKPGYSSLGGHYRKRLSGSNGSLGRRPTLICPERLKDFGEEEYLNGDVRTWETTVMGPPEVQLASPAQTSLKQDSECRPIPKPQPELLRFEDISTAALKIQSVLQKTPCTYSRLSKQYGLEIYLKKEHLHYTGSVKERGVLYLLSSLKQEEQRKGVIVATDCNFSMAVAYHAVELRIPVFVIMPVHSSPPRLRMYRDYGAMVISYGSTARDSQNHARHLATENGYLCLEEDDSAVYLAGLGTVGIEIYEQVPKLDAVIVPAGGQCGLLAGIATAVKHLNSRIAVIGVEPEDFPLLLQSLKTDTPIKDLYCSPNRKLYGDLLVHSMGTNSFQLAKKMVDKVITVREEDALVAMLRFQEYERSTVDTEGAMGLAAILAGQLPDLKGKRVAVVVSSANMEMELVRQCVERALVLDDRVSRFSVQLGDWPGDMAKLLDLLAREDVRLLDVCHRRHSDRTELFKAQVECVVETRDKTQNCQLRRMLSDRYPSLRWLDR